MRFAYLLDSPAVLSVTGNSISMNIFGRNRDNKMSINFVMPYKHSLLGEENPHQIPKDHRDK